MTGFVFQDSYIDKVKRLTDEELGRLVRALAMYHATGEEQDLEGREVVAYDFIREDIDRIDDKYETKCQTNRRNRLQEETNKNEQERSSTIVNVRQRSSTTVNDRAQDKVKDKDKDVYTTTTNRAREEETPFGTVTIDPLIVKVQKELNGLTDTHYQRLEDFRQFLGDDLVSFAIDAAVGNGVRNWNYVEAILKCYEKDGIKTIGKAKARAEKRKEERPHSPGKVLNAQKFSQRDYTEDELKSGTDDQILAEILRARKDNSA